METTLEGREGLLVATLIGRLTLPDALQHLKNVCDAAVEKGLTKILLDCLPLEGELSDLDRYELGKTMADYCLAKPIRPQVAIVGIPPAVNGFGAQVARNRGLMVRTFTDCEPGLNWLQRVTGPAR